MRIAKHLFPLFAALLATLAQAQSYPSKSVRVIVGYPPGGPTDLIARTFAQKLSDSFGHQVIVDNRPGASGMIGAELVVKAPPDGYTLLTVPITFAVIPSVFPKMPYDTEKDLAPVALIAAAPFILVVHPTLPVKTVKDLITLAKSRPGQINYASASSGGMSGFPRSGSTMVPFWTASAKDMPSARTRARTSGSTDLRCT